MRELKIPQYTRPLNKAYRGRLSLKFNDILDIIILDALDFE